MLVNMVNCPSNGTPATLLPKPVLDPTDQLIHLPLLCPHLVAVGYSFKKSSNQFLCLPYSIVCIGVLLFRYHQKYAVLRCRWWFRTLNFWLPGLQKLFPACPVPRIWWSCSASLIALLINLCTDTCKKLGGTVWLVSVSLPGIRLFSGNTKRMACKEIGIPEDLVFLEFFIHHCNHFWEYLEFCRLASIGWSSFDQTATNLLHQTSWNDSASGQILAELNNISKIINCAYFLSPIYSRDRSILRDGGIRPRSLRFLQRRFRYRRQTSGLDNVPRLQEQEVHRQQILRGYWHEQLHLQSS